MNSIDFSSQLRSRVLKMTHLGQSSHIGSILSISDLISVLFTSPSLNFSFDDMSCLDRDRLILSKGHAGAAIYAALNILELLPDSVLYTHYQNGSLLSGHVSHLASDYIEFSTGSLGHGLPVSTGIALSNKIKGINRKSISICSDGELDEGSNWEAILFAAHHKLSNLIMFIDRNKLQSIKSTEETLALEPLKTKLSSFNWHCVEIDGHSHQAIEDSINLQSDKPVCIICNTIKGKGVSFMENEVLWHYRSPTKSDLLLALNELHDA